MRPRRWRVFATGPRGRGRSGGEAEFGAVESGGAADAFGEGDGGAPAEFAVDEAVVEADVLDFAGAEVFVFGFDFGAGFRRFQGRKMAKRPP